MNPTKTVQALTDITDPGFFERLATAILRKANPNYSSIVHTGVNARGTTVKSPVDGICFVQGADPPHMVVLHHTIIARRDLRKKWLHDPSDLNPQIGDLVKTVKLAAEERARTPNLCVTLVLTTNKEPDEALVRDVNEKGQVHEVKIDLWSCSRLADFLDNDPAGQWIRRKFLKIEQEQLSAELFHELSKKSLQLHKPISNPNTWISRTLDVTLMSSLRHDVTFLVGDSGLGKSVACYRRLKAHIENGGFGIILHHEFIASTMTLDQVVERVLRELHPSLSAGSAGALSFCSPTRPLLLVVEDINRSEQTRLLAERIASWSQASNTNDNNYRGTASRWQLLCPLWPDAILSLGDELKKRIERMIVTTGGFTKNEGREAVLTRARIEGRGLSGLDAEETSHALGHDPLLIALHDPSKEADPSRTIGEFIDSSLFRVAESSGHDHIASDYRQTLLTFAEEILVNRQTEPAWNEIRNWPNLKGDSLRLLSHLVHQGEVIHLRGPSHDQRIFFRHDRVRDWLLADAVTEQDLRNQLPEDILTEPFFAEVIGMALAWGRTKSSFLKRVAKFNPLALFQALRLFGEATESRREFILDAINSWLEDPTTHDPSNLYLRLEALAILAETNCSKVPALIQKFHDRATSGELARLRNGDLSGGIELCSHIEPGVSAPWRDTQIEHAKLRHGSELTKALDEFIRREDLKESERIGALRLSGHIAATGLAPAIEACWLSDEERGNHLADYLWAFAQCCGDEPARYLGPVCDAWARLPEQSDIEGDPSPRHSLAADEICWAFRKWPPAKAINYFIERGSKDELRWPITYMLHGMDHPKAIVFVVQELAAIRREDTGLFVPLLLFASDHWKRLQKNENRPMSKASRDSLLSLWKNKKNDKYLRTQAFEFWAATQSPDDIEVLQDAEPSDELQDKILQQRLIREDQSAIPELINKLAMDSQWYWWHYARHIWSPEINGALDDYFIRRRARVKRSWGESFELDWIIQKMVMCLPVSDAEYLLLKHWNHLRFEPLFVQTALYISTPKLIDLAHATIEECPNPAKLMVHLHHRFGLRTEGYPGLTREAQLVGLSPYLHLMSPDSIYALWGVCNDLGWFTIRRELLDDHLQEPYLRKLWTRNRAWSELDKMIAEQRPIWIDHWIDNFMKTGVPWREILSTMVDWLKARRSFEALYIVAAAIERYGTRADIEALKIYKEMPELRARQLIQNTQFVVCRRNSR